MAALISSGGRLKQKQLPGGGRLREHTSSGSMESCETTVDFDHGRLACTTKFFFFGSRCKSMRTRRQTQTLKLLWLYFFLDGIDAPRAYIQILATPMKARRWCGLRIEKRVNSRPNSINLNQFVGRAGGNSRGQCADTRLPRLSAA